MRQDQEEERKAARERRAAASNQPYGPPRSDEGYFSSFQRAVQEGTGSIGSTGETMDKLEADSSNWAEDVNKFVNSQKRKATLGCRSPSSCWYMSLGLLTKDIDSIGFEIWPLGCICWEKRIYAGLANSLVDSRIPPEEIVYMAVCLIDDYCGFHRKYLILIGKKHDSCLSLIWIELGYSKLLKPDHSIANQLSLRLTQAPKQLSNDLIPAS